ncbi:transcriptional regulator, TetR family [Kineococcus radiotolerans SRS30216 = ATCC BAA-149]|uniref:Transcriptional regulator, TetR family n=1 Tax=Kineococcus radiotolerans (strain ATCC BAA-149 / DSM 14245 / SRS30216) TaxID=266940 RepID=A6WA26_KINRD|nr:transcriptional regulator, TetR family [Kineococcus radiotolerans SRS30216 = ATCC BAA-149]
MVPVPRGVGGARERSRTADTGEVTRPLRADARRNREAILRAAREAFEVEGVLTSLDGIAARAGVGNATLYRNFPTRDDLLAAAIQDSITETLAEADELSRTLTPRAALGEWLVLLTWRLRIWHDLPYCLATAHEDTTSPVQSACNPLLQRTAALLARAGVGENTPGTISAEEVYELVLALSWAVDRFKDDEVATRRRVGMATAGILA